MTRPPPGTVAVHGRGSATGAWMREIIVDAAVLAEHRELARRDPAAGIPKLATTLTRLGRRAWHERGPVDGIPYFEEAADLWRASAADGDPNRLAAASTAFTQLATQCSAVDDDERALAARLEAAALARRDPRLPRSSTRVFTDLAHALAEAGRCTQAAAVQREALPGDDPAAVLEDLAGYLELAGQIEQSLEVERELLTHRWSHRAMWTASASLRFADAGHAEEARTLLREAIAGCAEPRAGDAFHARRDLFARLFARAGARDEPAGPGRPVLGPSIDRWAPSIRRAYLAGIAAMDEAIAAFEPLPSDPRRGAELSVLLRRRVVRAAMCCPTPARFHDEIVVVLARRVELERSLRGHHGPRPLVRALVELAVAALVTGAAAAALLGEALDVTAHVVRPPVRLAAAIMRDDERRPPAGPSFKLGNLAQELAEAGQFTYAVAVQRELVAGSGRVSDLQHLAVYLELAGQTEAGLQVCRELLAAQREHRAIWAAGLSLRFADAGHPDEARQLLQRAVDTCDDPWPEDEFVLRRVACADLLARSGAADEPTGPGHPVLGVDVIFWASGLRDAYSAGLAAIDAAIAACDTPSELSTLLRRRAIRAATLYTQLEQFHDGVVVPLARRVALERALRDDHGPARLARALTDQAMAALVVGDIATARDGLREALQCAP